MVDGFFALGLAFLLTELLTRRMRYMSRIDETAFQEKVVAAATAASNDETAGASEALTRAFEILMEARAHFYPVDTNLLDFALVAETTIGDCTPRRARPRHRGERGHQRRGDRADGRP